MKKIIIGFALAIISGSVFAFDACPMALPTNDPGFCASFQSVAQCHCNETGTPKAICSSMERIYIGMIARFGSVQRACEYQHNTSTQDCIDDWTCYKNGGTDSQGRMCSSSGNKCG